MSSVAEIANNEDAVKQLQLYGSRNKRDFKLHLWLDIHALHKLSNPSDEFKEQAKRIFDTYLCDKSEKSVKILLPDHNLDTIAKELVGQ